MTAPEFADAVSELIVKAKAEGVEDTEIITALEGIIGEMIVDSDN